MVVYALSPSALPALPCSITQDKAHQLFGGTKILQHTGDKDARIRSAWSLSSAFMAASHQHCNHSCHSSCTYVSFYCGLFMVSPCPCLPATGPLMEGAWQLYYVPALRLHRYASRAETRQLSLIIARVSHLCYLCCFDLYGQLRA